MPTIPTLQKFQSAPSPSPQGRINITHPGDDSQFISSAFNTLAKGAADIGGVLHAKELAIQKKADDERRRKLNKEQKEQEAAEKKAAKAATTRIVLERVGKYKVTQDASTENLSNHEGENTKVYHQARINAKKQQEELTEGLNEVDKAAVTNGILKADTGIEIKRTKQQIAQQEVRDQRLVGITADNLMNDAVNLDANDRAGFAALLADGRYLFINQGLNHNTVVKDKNGETTIDPDTGEQYGVKIGDITKDRISGFVQKTVIARVSNLTDAKEHEDALATLEKYKDSITDVHYNKLKEELDELELEDNIKLAVKSTYGLPLNESIAKLGKEKNDEVRLGAIKLLNQEETVRLSLEAKRDNQNSEALFGLIDAARKEGRPFLNFTQLENSTDYKVFAKISHKNKQLLKKYLEPSKSPTPLKHIANIQKLIGGNHPDYNILTMSEIDFQLKFIAPINNQAERNRYNTIFEKSRTEKSDADFKPGEYRARTSMVRSNVINQMVIFKVIKKKNGFFDDRDTRTIVEVTDKIQNLVELRGVTLATKDIRSFVQRYVRLKRENKKNDTNIEFDYRAENNTSKATKKDYIEQGTSLLLRGVQNNVDLPSKTKRSLKDRTEIIKKLHRQLKGK